MKIAPCSLSQFQIRSIVFLLLANGTVAFCHFSQYGFYISSIFAFYLVGWYLRMLLMRLSRGKTTPYSVFPDNYNKKADKLIPTQVGDELCLFISVIVPAKNEEDVIKRTIESFSKLDYPKESFEVIIIDDHSTDNTLGIILECQRDYAWLKLVSRKENGGGKAGAMNSGYFHLSTKSQVVGYVDADTTVPVNMLKDLNQFFLNPNVYAVQIARMVRSKSCFGLIEKLQYFEVWMDLCYQQTREACGGCVEFRGNGEFLRRSLLLEMGAEKAWNEFSLTDDLDMSFRLHISGYNIVLYDGELIVDDPVHSWSQLWQQRIRWMTGGFQRFIDYTYFLAFSDFEIIKKLDVCHTFGVQYLLAVLYAPDVMWSFIFGTKLALENALNLNFINLFGTMALAWNRSLESAVWSQESYLDFVISPCIMLLSPLYVINLGCAVIVSVYRTPFYPRQLEYVKALHSDHCVEPKELSFSIFKFFKRVFFPLFLGLIVFQIFFIPLIAK